MVSLGNKVMQIISILQYLNCTTFQLMDSIWPFCIQHTTWQENCLFGDTCIKFIQFLFQLREGGGLTSMIE